MRACRTRGVISFPRHSKHVEAVDCVPCQESLGFGTFGHVTCLLLHKERCKPKADIPYLTTSKHEQFANSAKPGHLHSPPLLVAVLFGRRTPSVGASLRPALPGILSALLQLSTGPRQRRTAQDHAAGTAVVAHGEVEPVRLQGIVLGETEGNNKELGHLLGTRMKTQESPMFRRHCHLRIAVGGNGLGQTQQTRKTQRARTKRRARTWQTPRLG